MPFFNLECGQEGIVMAVGWPGQWAARFVRDDKNGLSVVAGQESTRFVLYPGEEVRTPGIVLLFWKDGDWIDAQNQWRRWMMAHGMPRPGGEPPKPMLLASSSRAYEEMHGANEQNQIMFIDRYLEEGLDIDYWWMDAGWYPCEGSWSRVGTWEVDATRFPNGFKPISDHAHARGLKTLVWFEPERVTPGRWITLNHPEWVLGGANGGLLNLGEPEVREWLTNHVDKVLTDSAIDLYRQDFNMEPLPYWRALDTEDRVGMAEIRHVTGYLAYWDELLRRLVLISITQEQAGSAGGVGDLQGCDRGAELERSEIYRFECMPRFVLAVEDGIDGDLVRIPVREHEQGRSQIRSRNDRDDCRIIELGNDGGNALVGEISQIQKTLQCNPAISLRDGSVGDVLEFECWTEMVGEDERPRAHHRCGRHFHGYWSEDQSFGFRFRLSGYGNQRAQTED